MNYNALVLANRRINDESRTDRPSSRREEYSLGDRRQRRNGEGCRSRADRAEKEGGEGMGDERVRWWGSRRGSRGGAKDARTARV